MKSQTHKGDYFPEKINQYVPNMQYAADVSDSGIYRVTLGSPALADTDGLLDGIDTTATSGTITVTGNANLGVIGREADAPFGRNITITGAGVGAKVLTFVGRDYLGQPMKETITCTGGAGTGKKAFKFVDEIVLGAVAGDGDSDIGWGDVLGLPYRTIKVLSEEADGVVEGTLGDLVGGVDTTATATTGDTRGTYNPQTALDGSVDITITAMADSNLVAQDTDPETYVGGLHGVPQYYV